MRDLFDVLAKEIPIYRTADDDRPERLSAESASYVQSQMPLLTSTIMHRGVLRMIREMITEDFPRDLGGFGCALPPQDGSMPGSLGGHLCSPDCPFFREVLGQPRSAAAMETQVYCPPGDEIGNTYGADDETLMYPLLFGSAEF